MDLLSEELDCGQPFLGRASQPEGQRRLLALLVIERRQPHSMLDPKCHG
jgi:hypothetical protein